jgi:hypothetical protein
MSISAWCDLLMALVAFLAPLALAWVLLGGRAGRNHRRPPAVTIREPDDRRPTP